MGSPPDEVTQIVPYFERDYPFQLQHVGGAGAGGQGWFGFDLTPDALAAHLENLDAKLAEKERSRQGLLIYAAPPRARLEDSDLERYRDLDIDQLILPLFGRDSDNLRSRADALAKQTLS